MIENLIALLPQWLQRLIRPELTDIISTFTKTQAKLDRYTTRVTAEAAAHNETAAALIAAARSKTAGADAAKRVYDRLQALLD